MSTNQGTDSKTPSLRACLEDWVNDFVEHLEGGEANELVVASRAALSAQAAPPAPEPVAWRFRHLNARWTYIEAEEYRLAPHGREGWTIEPLYAAQAEPKTLADIWEDLDHQDAMEYLAELGGAIAAPPAVPQRKAEPVASITESETHYARREGYVEGWNECLDALAGAIAAPEPPAPDLSDVPFLIHFDDADCKPRIVIGEAAARHVFKEVSGSWNAHLFVKIASNTRDDRYASKNAALAGTPQAAIGAPAEPDKEFVRRINQALHDKGAGGIDTRGTGTPAEPLPRLSELMEREGHREWWTPDIVEWLQGYENERPGKSPEAVIDVLRERERQKTVEGWTAEHDDNYRHRELAYAAACYAQTGTIDGSPKGHWKPDGWPWDAKWWKAGGQRRNLVKAGALILAEIERLDRAALANERRG